MNFAKKILCSTYMQNTEDLDSEILSLKINYKIYGNDEVSNNGTIVLIHGWSNSLEVISPLAGSLKSFFKVYSIDLPGHGKSEIPSQIWDMESFAKSLKNFLDGQGILNAFFVGHSFGGKTIIKFSDLYPEYVNKIVLIGASGLRPKPNLKKKIYFIYLKFLRNFIRFKNTKLGQKIYNDWYIPKYASRDYKNAGPMTKTFVKTLNEELHLELSRNKKQALLIWGSKDDESPVSVGMKMHELLSNSKLVILEGRDHFPFIGSGLSLLTKYIRDFLVAGLINRI